MSHLLIIRLQMKRKGIGVFRTIHIPTWRILQESKPSKHSVSRLWIACLLSIKKLIEKCDSLSPGPHQCPWFPLNFPQLIGVRAGTVPKKPAPGLLFSEPCFHFASFPGTIVIHGLVFQKFCILRIPYKKWKVHSIYVFPLTIMYLFNCLGFYGFRIICLVIFKKYIMYLWIHIKGKL